MRIHQFSHFLHIRTDSKNIVSNLRMRPHDFPFRFRQCPRLEQYGVRHGNLADIMQQRSLSYDGQFVLRHIHSLPNRYRQIPHSQAVLSCRLFPRIQETGQRLQRKLI